MAGLRPKRVKIGPQTFRVKYCKQADGAAGRCYQVEQVIEIDTRQPECGVRATLLHEILHAMFWVYVFPEGKVEPEEKMVRALASPLLSVLQENPDLVAYLQN